MAARKTASAKKAAKPRRKSQVEAWAESYLPLTDAAQKDLAFLTRKYGYAAPTVAVVPPSALVTFTRGEDFVRVASEYGGPPWVTVKAGEGQPYGLNVIIPELDPDYVRRAPVPAGDILTPAEMRAAIDYFATFLKAHADEVLRGDPALLARFHAREAALRSQPR